MCNSLASEAPSLVMKTGGRDIYILSRSKVNKIAHAWNYYMATYATHMIYQ